MSLPLHSWYRGIAALMSLGVLPGYAMAAVPAPKEDVHFLAEHLAEAALDARYFAQPLPLTTLGDDNFHPFVSVAASRFSNRLSDAGGGLLTLGVESRLRPGWYYSLSAFYDSFSVDGPVKDDILTASNLPAVPLDLPESAAFSTGDGRFRHEGAAAILSFTPEGLLGGGFAFSAGLMAEHLTLKDYELHYRLKGGADSGQEGGLAYAANVSYLTPFFGAQYDYALSKRLHLVPVVAAGWPLPAGDMNITLSGPGFSANQKAAGVPVTHIGDPWIRAGLGLQDRRLGLEYELGTLLSFSGLERLTHQGVDKGLLFSVTWHLP